MISVPVVILAVLFGIGCGWFQYWMAVRLDRKRWLLWLQPGLFAVIALCFGAWVLSLDRLGSSPARFSPLAFVFVLACTAAGWFLGNRKRRKP